MGLFSPKGNKMTSEEYIQKYDLANLSHQDIIRKIATDLADSGLTKESLTGKANINIESQILYLDTLVEQNWLILKQLEKLNNRD